MDEPAADIIRAAGNWPKLHKLQERLAALYRRREKLDAECHVVEHEITALHGELELLQERRGAVQAKILSLERRMRTTVETPCETDSEV